MLKTKDSKRYIYDVSENKEIVFEDLFDDLNFKKEFNIVLKYYVKDYLKTTNVIFKESNLDNLILKKDSIKKYMLSKEGLEVYFFSNDLNLKSSNNLEESEDIKIILPYKEINHILKEKYCYGVNKIHRNKTNPITRNLLNYKNKKVVAFTFDDGPSNYTNLLLENVKKHNARVTFFMLGENIIHNKQVIKKAYLEGHEIGNHSYNHANFFHLNKVSIEKQITDTSKILTDIIGADVKMFRPPY